MTVPIALQQIQTTVKTYELGTTPRLLGKATQGFVGPAAYIYQKAKLLRLLKLLERAQQN
jgi:hypothetical protein